MKEYTDAVEITFSDITTALRALIQHTEGCVTVEAPVPVVKTYATTARRLNAVLAENGFNHYTDEKFQQFDDYINKCRGGE